MVGFGIAVHPRTLTRSARQRGSTTGCYRATLELYTFWNSTLFVLDTVFCP